MVKDTTIDFLILYPDGHYLSGKKVRNDLKKNHLNARSFSYKVDAEKVKGNGRVVRRICSILECSEPLTP